VAWGDQDSSQLGDPDLYDDSPAPVRVRTNDTNPPTFLDHVDDIAAGGRHSLALKLGRNPDGSAAKDGTVWAWGNNSLGQLGMKLPGISWITTHAREIPGLDHVTAVAAGDDFSLALKIGRHSLGMGSK
jgi:hypothetical protein